jgi:hypothetical protein
MNFKIYQGETKKKKKKKVKTQKSKCIKIRKNIIIV